MRTKDLILLALAGFALGEAFKACPAHAGNNDVEQITSELRQLRQTEQAQLWGTPRGMPTAPVIRKESVRGTRLSEGHHGRR